MSDTKVKIISTNELKRLASILGMLGSNQVGERDNAARLAEKFRLDHDMSWTELLTPQSVVVTQLDADRKPTKTEEDYRDIFRKAAQEAAKAERETKAAQAAKAAAAKAAELKALKNKGLRIISTFLSCTCIAILWCIFGWKDTLLFWIIVSVFETMKTGVRDVVIK